jgi:hypothetical protein
MPLPVVLAPYSDLLYWRVGASVFLLDIQSSRCVYLYFKQAPGGKGN